MKVAFGVFGGGHWTGGINYLENLLSALSEQPDCGVRPVLFVGADADPGVIARLSPYLSEPIVVSSVWSNGWTMRLTRWACAFGLQRDYPCRTRLSQGRHRPRISAWRVVRLPVSHTNFGLDCGFPASPPASNVQQEPISLARSGLSGLDSLRDSHPGKQPGRSPRLRALLPALKGPRRGAAVCSQDRHAR